jgi:DNA-binding transcriptional ArsR family regulator
VPSPNVSTIFAALADPTRRAILARLSKGEAPVKELAEPFSLSGPAITKHLKVLERAGLISRSREGQQRPCRLEPHALAPAADWIEQYRAMWEERLDRLGEYLKSSASTPARPAAGTRNKRTPGGKPGKNPRGKQHGRQR